MKAASLRKQVNNLRKPSETNRNKWGGRERGSMKRVIYKLSVISQFNLNARSSDTLLDSAASVYVFNKKERFSNFKRALKGQGLLCSSNVISIEQRGQIPLPLKVKGRIKLLASNDVTYISNLLFNLVFLGCLQKCGFDWSHRLGKISKNNQIFGYTRFHINNYKIGEDEKGEIVCATLAADPVTLRNSRLYQRSNSATISDTWYCKIGYIGPLGLQMLSKECLEVRLQGKMMFRCTYCAMSKISQQLSNRSLSNQPTQLFQRVYIDWLDLEDKWDSYQGNGAVVGQSMVAVCEATGIAITYVMKSGNESENLPLTQNLVNWLAKPTIWT